MFDQGTLSDTLGALSIVTWLGAQSPQIYENYKNGSVEGLALPFLISWFWGDFTNFVGCVLTHQLPFQTYLATYFLFVDVALVSQYYYYSRRKPPRDLPPLSESFPYAQGSGPHHPPYIHPRKASKSRQNRRSRSSRSRSFAHLPSAASEDPLRHSFMSEAAHSTRSAPTPNLPPHTRENSHSNSSCLPSNVSSTSLYAQGEPPSPTIPERGRTLTRNIPVNGGGGASHLTFDPTLSTIYGSPADSSSSPYLIHTSQTRLAHHHNHVSFNPSLPHLTPMTTRTPSTESLNQHGHPQHQNYPSRGSSSRSRPPPPSRRATGIAFLSVGLLFTLGKVGRGSLGGAGGTIVRRGEAWSTSEPSRFEEINPSWSDRWTLPKVRHPVLFHETVLSSNALSKRSTYPLDVSIPSLPSPTPAVETTRRTESESEEGDEDRKGGEGPDWERIIGRMSAWLCTTLYLTSRLPQIWRNFRRRSVEGLAMTLFFFAFIGNSLYVASILTNPLSQTEPGYIIESTPYLLGSGGTLCFDLMIMFQAWIYSEKRKGGVVGHHRGRKGGLGKRTIEEEAASLLAGQQRTGDDETDLEHGNDYDEGSERTTTRGRRNGGRSRDSSVGYGRSISSQGSRRTATTTNLSMTRSRSTEFIGGGGRSASARAERGNLEDRQFDWEDHDEVTRPRRNPLSRGNSNGSSLSSSRVSSGTREETIPEAGESSVTVRD